MWLRCDYSAKPPANGFNPCFIFLHLCCGRLRADGSDGEAAIQQATSAHGSSNVWILYLVVGCLYSHCLKEKQLGILHITWWVFLPNTVTDYSNHCGTQFCAIVGLFVRRTPHYTLCAIPVHGSHMWSQWVVRHHILMCHTSHAAISPYLLHIWGTACLCSLTSALPTLRIPSASALCCMPSIATECLYHEGHKAMQGILLYTSSSMCTWKTPWKTCSEGFLPCVLEKPLMSNMRSCMDHVYNIIICYVIHDHQMFSNYQPLRPKNLPWYRSTFKNYLMDWVHDPAIFQPQHLSFGCARCLSAVKWSRQSHRPTVLPKSMVKLLNFHKNQLDIYSHNSCKIWVAHSSSGGSQALPQSVSECGPCPPSRKPQLAK